jgi:hypothetical protein
VLAASGDAADSAVAAKTLQSLLDEVSRKGLVALQLEARLALGETEIRANNFKVAHTLRLRLDPSSRASCLLPTEPFNFSTPYPTAPAIRPASSAQFSGRGTLHQSGLVIVATRTSVGLCTTRRDGGMQRATRGAEIAAIRDSGARDFRACTPGLRSIVIGHTSKLAKTRLQSSSANCQHQNTRRKANCINRGVVSVDVYAPNWVGPSPIEG